MTDESEMFRMSLNHFLMESNELSEMIEDYDTKVAVSIIRSEPRDMVEYKIAELQSKMEHKGLLTKIHKKQNFIESIKLTLSHQDLMLEEYKKFEKENQELFELLDKLFGDD